MKKKPELLAPAGDMEKLKMAVLYGADAVYLAGTSFGMRETLPRRSCRRQYGLLTTAACVCM